MMIKIYIWSLVCDCRVVIMRNGYVGEIGFDCIGVDCMWKIVLDDMVYMCDCWCISFRDWGLLFIVFVGVLIWNGIFLELRF